MRFIEPVLNVMICALAERGAQIEKVSIKPANITTPNLNEKKMEITAAEINSVLGKELKNEEIIKLLGMSRFDVIFEKNFICKYPAYRQDIIDSRDIIEDIIISYGYNKIETEKPMLSTTGKNSKENIFSRRIAQLMTGIEAQEVATFTLTSKDKLFKKMKIQSAEKIVEIANPVSENFSCLRNWMLPSMLEFLFKNKDSKFPQKIFEIGNCIKVEGKKAQDKLKLCCAISDAKTNFTEIRQDLEFLIRELGIENVKIEKTEKESFIRGRCASIMVDKKEIGFLGEIHPGVLENWGLNMPTSAFEIDLTELVK